MSLSLENKSISSEEKSSLESSKVNEVEESFTTRYFAHIAKEFNEQKGSSLDIVIQCQDDKFLCSSSILFTASSGTQDLLSFIKEIDGQATLKVPFPCLIVKDLLDFYYNPKPDIKLLKYELSKIEDIEAKTKYSNMIHSIEYAVTCKYFSDKLIENGDAVIYLKTCLYLGFIDLLKNMKSDFFGQSTSGGVVNYFTIIDMLNSAKLDIYRFIPRNTLKLGAYKFIRDNLEDPLIRNLFEQPYFFSSFPCTLYLLDTLIKGNKSFEEIINNKFFRKRKLSIGECLCKDYAPQLMDLAISTESNDSSLTRKIFPQIKELRQILLESYNKLSELKESKTSNTINSNKPLVLIVDKITNEILPYRENYTRLCIKNGSPCIVDFFSTNFSLKTVLVITKTILIDEKNIFRVSKACPATYSLMTYVDNLLFDDQKINDHIKLDDYANIFSCFQRPLHNYMDKYENLQIGRNDEIDSKEPININVNLGDDIMNMKSGYYNIV